jgi:succinylglutamate desuccinylase
MRLPEAPPSEERRYQRLLGMYTTGRRGPMVVLLGGIHGNEPAGVHALRRVLTRLQSERLPLAGKLVAVCGNLEALGRGQRFVSRDLNRQWLAANIARLRARDPATDDSEDREQRELLRVFDQCVAEAEGRPVLFLDLHTSSSDGPPFCCMGDTIPNRGIAFGLQVPVILGLEETVDGAVLEYFNELGQVAITIEGGRHDSEHTVARLEAAVWLGLITAGVLPESSIPEADELRRELRAASRGAPPVVEIRRHHKITAADRFVMLPGFESFQPISKGQVLARDRNGEVRAHERGLMLLPLYQGLGDDGFFACREVPVFWLRVAKWLRRLRLDLALPLLPGVRRVRSDELLVDTRLARLFVREIFHLLGYRRVRPHGDRLVFTRRRVAAAAGALPWRG